MVVEDRRGGLEVGCIYASSGGLTRRHNWTAVSGVIRSCMAGATTEDMVLVEGKTRQSAMICRLVGHDISCIITKVVP